MENVLIMIDSLLMAFSLYSRIPVPQAEWNDRSMKYCICFLPLVGVVIGAVQYGLLLFLDILNAGPVLRGALLAFFPVFLSGGIHMDGFLDTCDAIHSWKGPEERLRILKDPHVGAFAVIGGLLYFLLAAGIWSEADTASALTLSLVFVLSRALSAFSALFFPKAKKDGMLRGETDPAAKGASGAMAAAALAAMAVMILTGRLQGVCGAAASAAVLLFYYRTATRMFGGTTGDLAGWFLQLCELAAAGAVVLCGLVMTG